MPRNNTQTPDKRRGFFYAPGGHVSDEDQCGMAQVALADHPPKRKARR